MCVWGGGVQPSMKFYLLINKENAENKTFSSFKFSDIVFIIIMLINVGILAFMSMISVVLS